MIDKRILIILPTKQGLGGAEKRFFGLWAYLNAQNLNVFLVCSADLLNNLKETAEAKNFLKGSPQLLDRHIEYDFNFDNGVVEAYRDFRKKIVHNKDVLNFILVHPLIRFSNKTIFSCTFTSLEIFSLKGKIIQLLSAFNADMIDILDPSTYRMFRKLFFWKKNRIFLTPGSYTDTSIFTPEIKENIITFCGRLSQEKQIIPFIQAVPLIHNKLAANKLPAYKIRIIGTGPQEDEIQKLLNQKEFASIDITCGFEAEPHNILNRSKIFLSLQKHNNYPSKSLIEAISAGNAVVATECGDTKLLAKEEFSELVPEQFNADELSNAVIKIAKRLEDQKDIPGIGHKFIENNFTLKKTGDYFTKLYFNN